MQQLKPFSKSSPCPICGGGVDCRQGTDDPDLILCHSEAEAKLKEIVRGQDGNLYICLAEAKGHTATFKPVNCDDRSKKDERSAQCHERSSRHVCQSGECHNHERSLQLPQISDTELDSFYRRILAELPLGADYKAALLLRGYSEQQIEDVGFKTLPKWFKPSFPLPENFPGQIWVKGGEDRTLGRAKVYDVIPVYNNGLISALTLEDRNYNPSDGEGKYRRHSNTDFPFHREGEQPIQVYLPEGEHKRIWLGIEGGAHKPILFHLKSGEPAIAGMGCNLSSSPKLLATAIAKAKEKYGDDIEFIGIVPDAGAVLNPTVIKAYERNVKAFEGLGIDTKSAWWGQASVNDDDIDELADFSSIQFISNKEFFKLAKKEKDNAKPEGFAGKSFEGRYRTKENRRSPDWHNWVDSRKYTPDIILTGDGDLVLPKDLDIQGKNVFIKSGLGTNKTGATLAYLNDVEKEKGVYTILLSFINSLLHQTGDRAKQIGKEFVHIQTDEDGKLLAKDSKTNISACIHSLGYIDGHFDERIVFLDELESVMETFVSGANLGASHGAKIEMFFRGLRNSYGNTFTDANLTDLTVDLIGEITGRPCIKIEYRQSKKRVKTFNFHITPTKAGQPAINDPSAVTEKHLNDIRAGKKTFLTTDSRMYGEGILGIANNSKSELSEAEINLDKAIKEVQKDIYRSLIISRNTSGTDEGKAFLANPGQYLLENKIDLFVGTPSVGSGVSVLLPDDYFHSQYTSFCGVLGVNSQTQILARLRNNKLVHNVYCPIRSTIKDRSRPQEYSFTEFDASYEAIKAHGRSISIDQVQELIDLAQSRINPAFDAYSKKMGALSNFEQDNLLECLTYVLEEEGHKIILTFAGGSKAASDEIKAEKAAIRVRESEAFFKAEAFASVSEAEQVTKANPTPENHLRKDKTHVVLNLLPGIDRSDQWTPEFINNFLITDSQRKAINGVSREFMLKHFDISQESYNLRMLKNAQKSHPVGKDLLPGDFALLWAMHQLKVRERLLDVEQFTCKSPGVVALVADYTTRKDLQKIIRIEVPADKVVDVTINKLIKPLLGLLTMEAKEVSKLRVDGVVTAAYEAVTAFEEEKDKTAIYDCISEKWTRWHEKKELETQLASVKVQGDLEKQVNELVTEFRKAQADRSWDANLMSRADIKDISGILRAVDDEMLADLKEVYPAAVIAAAISTLSQYEIDRLAMLGAPMVSAGVYEQFCQRTAIASAWGER